MKYKWNKLNDKPITIEFKDYIPPTHELLLEPCIEWKGQTYFFKDLMRTKGNPWISNSHLPTFIDMYDPYNIEPLHFEILDNFQVNIYQVILIPD